jgi:hypothetical protein
MNHVRQLVHFRSKLEASLRSERARQPHVLLEHAIGVAMDNPLFLW